MKAKVITTLTNKVITGFFKTNQPFKILSTQYSLDSGYLQSTLFESIEYNGSEIYSKPRTKCCMYGKHFVFTLQSAEIYDTSSLELLNIAITLRWENGGTCFNYKHNISLTNPLAANQAVTTSAVRIHQVSFAEDPNVACMGITSTHRKYKKG